MAEADANQTLVRMPRLADTLVEGTVARWLKQVGDPISRGEPLAEIETDKVTTELPSPSAGSVLELLVADGTTVPVDAPIARIGAPGAAPEPSQPSQPSQPSEPPEPVAPAPVERPLPKPTPVAARILAEHGLEPTAVSSGRRITKAEVMRYLDQRAPSDGALEPLSPMRRAIADHMQRARQAIPHGQTVMSADLNGLVAWREQHAASSHGARITLTAFFVHALSRALKDAGYAPVHLGLAVALENGLIVPVIGDADKLDLADTARAIADRAERARRNALSPGETHGALMTVTNVGSFNNLFASPIVPLGQIGILGPGLVEQRPMRIAPGALGLGWRCLMSLVFDRRALDDLAADRLLRGVVDHLVHFVDTLAVPA